MSREARPVLMVLGSDAIRDEALNGGFKLLKFGIE